MATWVFEPGQTEAEFRARQMMVTWGGLFKDIHGQLELDWGPLPRRDLGGRGRRGRLWTGEPDRDAHLRSADFFDAEPERRVLTPASQER